ncbi:MAG: hypothetical protein WCR36_07300 [Bacteroidaceae bacterium]
MMARYSSLNYIDEFNDLMEDKKEVLEITSKELFLSTIDRYKWMLRKR